MPQVSNSVWFPWACVEVASEDRKVRLARERFWGLLCK